MQGAICPQSPHNHHTSQPQLYVCWQEVYTYTLHTTTASAWVDQPTRYTAITPTNLACLHINLQYEYRPHAINFTCLIKPQPTITVHPAATVVWIETCQKLDECGYWLWHRWRFMLLVGWVAEWGEKVKRVNFHREFSNPFLFRQCSHIGHIGKCHSDCRLPCREQFFIISYHILA